MLSKSVPVRFLLLVLALCSICGVMSAIGIHRMQIPLDTSLSQKEYPIRTVVLDAGHGGEDGGASDAEGNTEKDLNLSVCFLLCEMLRANGVEVIMTRTTDTLLYDKTADYQGRKKVLDLAARRKIAEATPDSVFVSIHMNTYPRPDCEGLQVWYSVHDPDSERVAEMVRESVKKSLQPENHRAIKGAGSSIYLLHNLKTPAILIECGFLSCPSEAERLNDPTYQKALAMSIFEGLMAARLTA